jgi:zinc-ribbon domain
MPSLVCANCHTENTEDARFCKRCGKRLSDDYVDPDLEQRLFERIEDKLKDKWLAREMVEKDVALSAATKLTEWAKIFAFAVGVPAAIAVGILAFVGIKSTTDLASIEAQTALFKKTASELEAQYKSLQEELPKLKEIAASVHGLENRIVTVENAVATFAPSTALKKSVESQLMSTLTNYKLYLSRLGLAPQSVLTVHVLDKLPKDGFDAYYEDNEIYVKSSHADPAKVVHEFSHNVLLSRFPGNADAQWEYSAIEAGVANYLTGDFLNSAKLDSVDLNERRSISATRHDWEGGQSEGGMAWGSFLWALRNAYTSEKATPAIVKAFHALRPSEPPQNYNEIFLRALTEAGLDWARVTQP